MSAEYEGLPQFAQGGRPGFLFIRWHIFFAYLLRSSNGEAWRATQAAS